MIKKVEIITNTQPQTELETSILRVFNGVTTKINELVDAVNESQKQIDKMSCAILDLATPNGENKALKSIKAESKTPADPYAEQRKWIGKACWFWDNNAQTKAFGWLAKIDTEEKEAPFLTNFGQWYDNCEPVKPDDDIIYKGDK